jgi:hypothetical protein
VVYCEAVLKTMGAESRLVLGGGRVPLWWGGGGRGGQLCIRIFGMLPLPAVGVSGHRCARCFWSPVVT